MGHSKGVRGDVWPLHKRKGQNEKGMRARRGIDGPLKRSEE